MIIHHPIASVSHPWTSQGPVSELKSSYGALSQDRETDGRLTTSRLNKGLFSFFTVLHALLAYIFLIWSFLKFLRIDLSIFAPNVFFWSTAPRIHRDRWGFTSLGHRSLHVVGSLQGMLVFLRFSKGDFFFVRFFLKRFAENTCPRTLSRMWGTSPCRILFFITGLVLQMARLRLCQSFPSFQQGKHVSARIKLHLELSPFPVVVANEDLVRLKFKMAFENFPSQQEGSIPTIIFLFLLLDEPGIALIG